MATQSLAHAQEKERSLAERVQEISTKEVISREQISQERSRRIEMETRLQEAEEKVNNMEEARIKEHQEMDTEKSNLREELEQLRKEREHLSASLSVQQSDSQSRRNQCVTLMEQLKVCSYLTFKSIYQYFFYFTGAR